MFATPRAVPLDSRFDNDEDLALFRECCGKAASEPKAQALLCEVVHDLAPHLDSQSLVVLAAEAPLSGSVRLAFPHTALRDIAKKRGLPFESLILVLLEARFTDSIDDLPLVCIRGWLPVHQFVLNGTQFVSGLHSLSVLLIEAGQPPDDLPAPTPADTPRRPALELSPQATSPPATKRSRGSARLRAAEVRRLLQNTQILADDPLSSGEGAAAAAASGGGEVDNRVPLLYITRPRRLLLLPPTDAERPYECGPFLPPLVVDQVRGARELELVRRAAERLRLLVAMRSGHTTAEAAAWQMARWPVLDDYHSFVVLVRFCAASPLAAASQRTWLMRAERQLLEARLRIANTDAGGLALRKLLARNGWITGRLSLDGGVAKPLLDQPDVLAQQLPPADAQSESAHWLYRDGVPLVLAVAHADAGPVTRPWLEQTHRMRRGADCPLPECWYLVRHHQAPELAASHAVVLWHGWVYLAPGDLARVFCDAVEARMSLLLACPDADKPLRCVLPNLYTACQLLLERLPSERSVGEAAASAIEGQELPDIEDLFSCGLAPPCLESLESKLRRGHGLRYWERIQYARELVVSGYSGTAVARHYLNRAGAAGAASRAKEREITHLAQDLEKQRNRVTADDIAVAVSVDAQARAEWRRQKAALGTLCLVYQSDKVAPVPDNDNGCPFKRLNTEQLRELLRAGDTQPDVLRLAGEHKYLSACRAHLVHRLRRRLKDAALDEPPNFASEIRIEYPRDFVIWTSRAERMIRVELAANASE